MLFSNRIRRQLESYKLNNNNYPLTISEIRPDTLQCREVAMTSGRGPPGFLRELSDVALKIGTKLSLSVEITNNNNPVESLKVTNFNLQAYYHDEV